MPPTRQYNVTTITIIVIAAVPQFTPTPQHGTSWHHYLVSSPAHHVHSKHRLQKTPTFSAKHSLKLVIFLEICLAKKIRTKSLRQTIIHWHSAKLLRWCAFPSYHHDLCLNSASSPAAMKAFRICINRRIQMAKTKKKNKKQKNETRCPRWRMSSRGSLTAVSARKLRICGKSERQK